MNVVFIAIDTLRADHLGCYGYKRNTSPNIDALAARGVLCEKNIAPAIPTHPAFVTLGTGQYSITHGIVAHGGTTPVPRTAPWLPSLLQKAGYLTCAVDNLAPWHHGFGRGFEYYIDPASARPLSINCDNRTINRRAIAWLEHVQERPFYLFIHYWDPHTPYLPPRAYRNLFYKGDPRDPNNRTLADMPDHPLMKVWRETWFNKLEGNVTDARYIEALYDGEIRYCDEGVGMIVKTLNRLGLIRDTLIVIVSDHGEMMFRHGIPFDHHGLYDGNLRTPLIFAHPDLGPRRIPHLTSHVDVAPTILDLCGVDIPKEIEGVSLSSLLRGDCTYPVRDFVVSQECTWQMKWSIRTDTHKFIRALEPDFYGTPMRELYDLTRDPGEFDNIAETDPDTAQALQAKLDSWTAEKMRENSLTEDPLVKHGITLGRDWQQKKSKRQE